MTVIEMIRLVAYRIAWIVIMAIIVLEETKQTQQYALRNVAMDTELSMRDVMTGLTMMLDVQLIVQSWTLFIIVLIKISLIQVRHALLSVKMEKLLWENLAMITTQVDVSLIVLEVIQDIHVQVVILHRLLFVFKFVGTESKQFHKNVMTATQITMMVVLLYALSK